MHTSSKSHAYHVINHSLPAFLAPLFLACFLCPPLPCLHLLPLSLCTWYVKVVTVKTTYDLYAQVHMRGLYTMDFDNTALIVIKTISDKRRYQNHRSAPISGWVDCGYKFKTSKSKGNKGGRISSQGRKPRIPFRVPPLFLKVKTLPSWGGQSPPFSGFFFSRYYSLQ